MGFEINVQVKGHEIIQSYFGELAAGSDKFDLIRPTFDSAWDGMTIKAVMYQKKNQKVHVDAVNGAYPVPAAVLEEGMALYIGFDGTTADGKVYGTTNMLRFVVNRGASASGTPGLTPQEELNLVPRITKLESDVSSLKEELKPLTVEEDENGDVHVFGNIVDEAAFEDTNTTYTFRVVGNKLYIKPSDSNEYSVDLPSTTDTNTTYTFRVSGNTLYVKPSNADEYGITLPSGGSSSGDSNGVYHVDNNGLSTSASNNTTALQTLINNVSANGGGTIQFGTGRYKFGGTIQIKSGITLQGAGQGATTLFYSGSGTFLNVPQTTTTFGINALTVCGSDANWTGSTMAMHNYGTPSAFSPTGTIGINVEGFSGTSDSERNKWVTKKETITQTPYKYGEVFDIRIIGFTGYGYYQWGEIYCVNLRHININNCGCGLVFAGSDCMGHDLFCEGCAYEGMIIAASNTKISNIKCIWSGMVLTGTTYKENSPYLTALNINNIDKHHTALLLVGNRSSYFGIETQDNCSYIATQITGDNLNAYGILSDGNGYIMGTGNASGTQGIHINGCHDSKIECAVTNYNNTKKVEFGILLSYCDYVEVIYSLSRANNINCCTTPLTIGTSVNNCITRRTGVAS